MYHTSVLLHESIEALNIKPSGIYIDGTFGLGGHSKLILSKLSKNGQLIAIDRDYLAVKIGKRIFKEDNRFSIIHTSFSKMFNHIYNMKLSGLIDGILLDLGISEFQLADSNRGFSFMKDGPLDMRMDITTGQSAASWIAQVSKKDITQVLKTFGEEKLARRIAEKIVYQRKISPIMRTHTLSKIICNTMQYYGIFCRNKHPATRSFLAIRIHINKELDEIKKVLQNTLKLLSPKGRLVVISFNSLEDRLVKHFINRYSRIIPDLPKLALTENQIFDRYCNIYQLKNIGKLMPNPQEIKRNIKARCAILRCAEKVGILHI